MEITWSAISVQLKTSSSSMVSLYSSDPLRTCSFVVIFELYLLKKVLCPIAFAWKRKLWVIRAHNYTQTQTLKCTHTHVTDGALGGVFQAEGSQGPPGDKAERTDEDNMEEEEQGFFHAQIYTVYLQVSCVCGLLNTF